MTVAESTQKAKSPKSIVGKVTSNKMDKTVVVSVERKEKDPLYGKYVRRYTKYFAHDENNEVNIGDWVKIKQARPLSKKKRWALEEVLEKKQ